MKLISCHDGKLHALNAGEQSPALAVKSFRTGLGALDDLPPGGAFVRGAVHELLSAPADPRAMLPAAWLAKCAGWDEGVKGRGGEGVTKGDSFTPSPLHPLAPASSQAIVWSDVRHELYPPALAALGIPLERLFLLHPTESEQLWAIAECLRCKGVGAVVAELPSRKKLSRVEARRLQLAAEQGGGVGLLLREAGKHSAEHSAATRWLVQPARGERNVQRWKMQLIFGHGGRIGQSILLEHHRDADSPATAIQAHPLHPPAQLADRPPVPTTA